MTAPHSTPLSRMVVDGAALARVRFGPDEVPVTGGFLIEAGTGYFHRSGERPTVAALLTNDRPSVEVLLGAIATGATLVSLPLPARNADPDAYLRFLEGACASQGATEVVCRDDIAELLTGLAVTIRPHRTLHERPLACPAPEGFELVQFSSGSTGDPKAIRLSDAGLGANVAALIAAIEPRPGDAVVSWLPLSHDMGLIGMLLTSLASTDPRLVGAGDLVVFPPELFLRSPALWLSALTELRGTVTAAPDFGYRQCVRHAERAAYDLSSLRFAIVGGEIVRASTLEAFGSAFARHGFESEAFAPAYGMAEVGLAVSVTPATERWHVREVDAVELADGRLAPAGSTNSREVRLVASGRPLDGYDVVADADDGHVGRLWVRAPSVGRDALDDVALVDDDGWLRTGDLGAVIDGSVFVTGRADDIVVVAARNIYAPAVESAIGAVDGVRGGRAVVIGLPSGDLVAIAEPEGDVPVEGPVRRSFVNAIERAVVSVAGVRPAEVVVSERGRIPVTPSGKVRRHEARRLVMVGEL